MIQSKAEATWNLSHNNNSEFLITRICRLESTWLDWSARLEVKTVCARAVDFVERAQNVISINCVAMAAAVSIICACVTGSRKVHREIDETQKNTPRDH